MCFHGLAQEEDLIQPMEYSGVQVQVDHHEYIIETIVNDHVLIRTSSCANKDKIKISIPEHYMLDSCGCSHGGQMKMNT